MRKSLTQRAGHYYNAPMNTTVPVRLPQKWRDELVKLAKKEDRTISAVIRRLIREGAQRTYGIGGVSKFDEE